MRVPPAAVLSRVTFTFVPSGNTVSRCAETTTLGPVATPGRSPITLPVASMRTLTMPSDSSRRLNSAARSASLNGGAAISQIDACCSSVHALSLRIDASAVRTAGWVEGTTIGCACSVDVSTSSGNGSE